MASISATAKSIPTRPRHSLQAVNGIFGLKSVSISSLRRSFPSIRLQPTPMRFRAKPETVQKVCDIVKKQLALAEDIAITGESKFSTLGADSLDTVEIVMGLEEAFNISVEEESAQNISTVQDAADLIETLVAAKSG